MFCRNNFVDKKGHQKKSFLEKMNCDAGTMIARDVAEKRYENKVGMSSY